LLVDAEPDGNRFDLDFDYRAPEGGLLAALVGAEDDLRLRLAGNGTWTRWDGTFLGLQDGDRIADFDVANRAGRYEIVGSARPRDYLTGLPARALGDRVALAMMGNLRDSVARGGFAVRGRGIRVRGEGAIDL